MATDVYSFVRYRVLADREGLRVTKELQVFLD